MFFGSAEQLPASIECENASPHFLRAKNTPIYAMMFGGDPGIISLAFVPESEERTSPEGRTREENKMCYTTSGRHKHCQHLQCLGRHPPCLTRHPPDTHTHTHTHTWVEEPKDCARAGQLYSHKWVSRGWSSTRPPGGSEQPSAPEGAPRPRRGDRRAGRQQHAFARAGQHVRIEKRPQTSTRATPRAPPVPHSTRPIRPTMPHPTPT